MKLSTLNRFRNKRIEVLYVKNDEEKEVKGILEEIAKEGITIDYGTGLIKIPIMDIITIIEEVIK